MKIYLNGGEEEIKINSTLEEFLRHKDITGAKGLAVAVNESVIPFAIWKETVLNQNDRVLIIAASRGG